MLFKSNRYNTALSRKINSKIKKLENEDLIQIENDIAQLQTDVATNTGDISNNTGDISNNTGDISNNTGDISNNAGDISTNAGDISINAGNISSNIGDISNHETRILALEAISQVIVDVGMAVDTGNISINNTSTSTYVGVGAFYTSLNAKYFDGSTYYLVQGVATFSNDTNQTGAKVKLQYRRNGGTWTDMSTGSTSGNPGGGYQVFRNISTSNRWVINIIAAMNITLAGNYQFRIVFAAFVPSYNITYLGNQADAIIITQEIKM